MRIVLDTNIWVSALLSPNGKAGQVLTAWRKHRLQIVTTEFILKEIGLVLGYSKIKKRLNWDEKQIEHYLQLLKLFTDFIDPVPEVVQVDRDKNDSTILSALLVSQADYLVTGDHDLLCLKQVYAIVSLSEFIAMY